MTDLFLSVLEISLSVSPVIVLLLLLAPFLNRRYAAKWSYLVWIFLALRLLIPFGLEDGQAAMEKLSRRKMQFLMQSAPQTVTQDEQDEAAALPEQEVSGRIVLKVPARITAPLAAAKKSGVSALDLIACIWGTGCAAYIVINIICYLYYKRRVMKDGTVLKDRALLEQLFRLKSELRVRRNIMMIGFSEACSPMLLGYLRPVLVINRGISKDICGRGKNDCMPEPYSGQELYFILKHELVHLGRGDLYAKFLFMAVCAMHWFNPLVWLMQKEAAVDMELSCDEKVIGGAAPAQKRAYTETLLATLHKGGAGNTVLSTGFYEGKKVMKKRFQNILRRRKKKNGLYILACVVILMLVLGTLIGCSVVKNREENSAEADSEGNAETPAGGELFAQMAGSWMIDFDRTDAALWGTGISFGDGMEIEKTGTFSYYIGIGVGGTGKCEEKDGVVTVEIEPYEEAGTEREILTLSYGKENGTEYILMDWHGENVYWKRGSVSAQGVPGTDLSDENSAADTITLTFMKEGLPEEKQAELVVENGYVLYLPVGEWQKAEADLWQSVINEDVRLCVAGFADSYPVKQFLTDDGYAPENEGMAKSEDGIRCHVRLHEAGDKVWCVFYSYPEEAEEGFGAELPVIADTFAALLPEEHVTETGVVSAQVLGYISRFGDGTVTIDRQDWVTPEDPAWKPEYDADAGFEVVDIAGADVTYPIAPDCRYHILENHQGESIEIDEAAFAAYLRETDFPVFWAVEVQEGQAVSFAEWYRP